MNSENDYVLFITESTTLKEPGVQLHNRLTNAVSKKLSEVRDDWNNAMRQVSDIVADTDSKITQSGYLLDEITISLGFTATGKVAFIAEAGVEASIAVKFKRK
jgi:hypothetical protein